MPLSIVVDGAGMIRFAHHGASMADIPQNQILFEVLDRLGASSE